MFMEEKRDIDYIKVRAIVMKWENKGYEVDKESRQLVENFIRHGKKVFIFGAGEVGRYLEIVLSHYNIFAGYIDNDPEKIAQGVNSKKVYSLEDYITEGRQGWIVIAAARKNISAIADQLSDAGYREAEDFFIYSNFEGRIFPILVLYLYDQVYMPTVQICVTERCSLKCRKCAHACYAVSGKEKDMELQEVFYSADCLFSKVDYVMQFVLIGGEPLLYEDLAAAIRYIGGKYRDKMGTFSITTNGTISPGQEVLDACKEYGVRFEISNYSVQIPRLEIQYRKLTELLSKNEVEYQLSKPDKQWTDYGFEYVKREVSEEELVQVFDKCQTPCKEIRGSRLYFCVMARSVSDNLHLDIGNDDYLDLNMLEGTRYKSELVEFAIGYSEKGYLDMCRHCNGADAVKYPIPVAEQI